MANRTDNPVRWTAMEHIAVYLPFVLLAIAILPGLCCQFNAVKFDFPAPAHRDRTPIETDSNDPTTRPARPSMTERVVDEDAVIDAVLADLMREEPNE